jgi:pseudouridine-5'-phosphate glycosidase
MLATGRPIVVLKSTAIAPARPWLETLRRRVAEALAGDLIQTTLEAVVNEATRQRVSGKPLTPILLDSIRRATLAVALLDSDDNR